MSKALDFGVQSFCFREFKNNADVAKKVREIGVDKLEICAIHADFSKPEAFKDVYSESDMQDLKEQLVQTFESVGQTAMFLKRKWETASRTEGSASTLIGV